MKGTPFPSYIGDIIFRVIIVADESLGAQVPACAPAG